MNIIKCSLCSNDSKLLVLNPKLESIIQKLLSIELQHKEEELNLICSACCSVITEFNKFRKKVRRLFRNSGTTQECEVDSTIEDGSNISTTSTKKVECIQRAKKNKITCESGNNADDVRAMPTAASRTQDATNKVIQEERNDVNLLQKTELSSEKRPYSSNDVQQLARHIRNQCKLTKEQRICSTCFTVCDSMKLLCEHRRTEHPEYQCKETDCSDTFADLTELRIHQKLKHPKKGYKSWCKTCNKKFEDPLAKRTHKCRSKKYECLKQCGNRFETEEELKVHFRKCRPGITSIFKCSICKKILSSSQTLKSHELKCSRTHVSVTKSTTTKTQRAVESNSVEEDAIAATSKTKMSGEFKCLKCNKKFDSVSTLETHFSTCNGDYSDSIKCSFCGKSFISEKSLQIHQMVESHEQPGAETLTSTNDENSLQNESEYNEKLNTSVSVSKEVKTEAGIVQNESEIDIPDVMIKEERIEVVDLSENMDVNTVNETPSWCESREPTSTSISPPLSVPLKQSKQSRWDSLVPVNSPSNRSWKDVRLRDGHNVKKWHSTKYKPYNRGNSWQSRNYFSSSHHRYRYPPR